MNKWDASSLTYHFSITHLIFFYWKESKWSFKHFQVSSRWQMKWVGRGPVSHDAEPLSPSPNHFNTVLNKILLFTTKPCTVLGPFDWYQPEISILCSYSDVVWKLESILTPNSYCNTHLIYVHRCYAFCKYGTLPSVVFLSFESHSIIIETMRKAYII